MILAQTSARSIILAGLVGCWGALLIWITFRQEGSTVLVVMRLGLFGYFSLVCHSPGDGSIYTEITNSQTLC